jgi:hypothetical protein
MKTTARLWASAVLFILAAGLSSFGFYPYQVPVQLLGCVFIMIYYWQTTDKWGQFVPNIIISLMNMGGLITFFLTTGD